MEYSLPQREMKGEKVKKSISTWLSQETQWKVQPNRADGHYYFVWKCGNGGDGSDGGNGGIPSLFG